jgi:hypothetical protein
MDNVERGAVVGIICRGNLSYRRKPGPEPLLPPQLPYDSTRALTQACSEESRRLIAGAITGPNTGTQI